MKKQKKNTKNTSNISIPQQSSVAANIKKSNGTFFNSTVAGILLVIFITAIFYIPAIRGGFVWDDERAILNNKLLRTTEGLKNIWFHPSVSKEEYHYWPMVYTFFWIEYHLWDGSLLGYHIVNVLFHILNTFLLWLILRRLRVQGALLAAALFGIHPIHVESVAWMVELKDILSGTFYLLALLVYLSFWENKKWYLYIFSLLFFVCALLSKSMAITFPAAILLLLWWKQNKLYKRDIFSLMPFFGVSLLYAIGDFLFTRYQEPLTFHFTIMEKFLIIGRSLWFYIGKIFFPYPIMAVYHRWQIDAQAIWQYLYPISAIAAFLLLWFQQKQWGRGVFVAVSFFAVTLSPVLGFINFGYMDYAFVADRFQYIASTGIIVLFSAIVTAYAQKLTTIPQSIKYAIVILVCLCLGIITWQQGNKYKTKEILFRHNVALNPNSPTVNFNLAETLHEQDKIDEAIPYFQKALELKPDYSFAYNNLGNILVKKEKLDEAIINYQKAIFINPKYAYAYNNLGFALVQKGRFEEALPNYLQAIKLNPDYEVAHVNVGNLYLQKGNLGETIKHFREVLRLNPGDVVIRNTLGVVLLNTGNLSEAESHFAEVIRSTPNDFEAYNNMGYALFQEKKYDEAIDYFTKSLNINSTNARVHLNIADALCAKKEYKDAISHYKEAIKIEPSSAEAHNNLAIVLLVTGDIEGAIIHFRQALQNDSKMAEAANNLAWIMATCREAKFRNGNEAIEIIKKYIDSTGDNSNPKILDTLAAGYAETGNFKEAIKTAQEALTQAQLNGRENLAKKITTRLELYKKKQPFRSNMQYQ